VPQKTQPRSNTRKRQLCIVGTGYVGLVTAVAFAKHGNPVRCVDVDEGRVRAVAAGRPPFFEPGLERELTRLVKRGLITASTDAKAAVAGADATFLCVGTPSSASGAFDLSQLEAAARSVGSAMRHAKGGRPHVVVTKSTVTPTANRTVVLPSLEAASRMGAPADFSLAVNPEFLREGSALADASSPARIVVGTMEGDTRAWRLLSELYRPFRSPIMRTSMEGAELVKLASNALLATKVAFANEVANLSAAVGTDGREVLTGVGMDPRLGPHFLRAGAGFGGSCFPKDLRALVEFAARKGMPFIIPKAALAQNDWQPLVVVDLVRRALGEDLDGKRIALLGLAFKAGTDDVRETRALPIYRALTAAGARVICHDPRAGPAFIEIARGEGMPEPRLARDLKDAIRGADAAVLQAEWPEYKELRPARLRALMNRPPVVVDGRRMLDPKSLRAGGVRYYAIGLPPEPERGNREKRRR
jgi:UDPglucose 6-dehydrogenase